LLSNNYFPGVSRFHDFWGIAAPNFSRRFQLCLAQLELPVLFPKKREIAQQRPISITKVKACPFHPALKQRETGCNGQCDALAQPAVWRSVLGGQRGIVINQINFPPALRRHVRDLIAIGGRITRDGVTVLVDGPPEIAGALRTETHQLATYIAPSVTPDDAALVRNLLTDAGTGPTWGDLKPLKVWWGSADHSNHKLGPDAPPVLHRLTFKGDKAAVPSPNPQRSFTPD
jgi:hypothetical protein